MVCVEDEDVLPDLSSTDVIIKELENYSNIRSGPNPNKINLGLDSEFNSIHFGIEININLKFLTPKMFGSN